MNKEKILSRDDVDVIDPSGKVLFFSIRRFISSVAGGTQRSWCDQVLILAATIGNLQQRHSHRLGSRLQIFVKRRQRQPRSLCEVKIGCIVRRQAMLFRHFQHARPEHRR